MKFTSIMFSLLIAFASTTSAFAKERRVAFTPVPQSLLGKNISIVKTYRGRGVHTKTIYCSGHCGGDGGGSWQCNDGEHCGINCAANPPYGYCY
jgi:hypothetical protein